MRLSIRIALLACLGAIASLVSYWLYLDSTFLARTLQLEAIPRSLKVVGAHEAAWTDYSKDWIVEIDPLEADQLLQGHDFERQDIVEPLAVFGSETGAYGVNTLANAKLMSGIAAKPVFLVGDGYCVGNWFSEDRICVWRSMARDRALITRAGD